MSTKIHLLGLSAVLDEHGTSADIATALMDILRNRGYTYEEINEVV